MPRKIRYIQKDHIKNLAGLSAARSTRDGWPSRPPDRRVNGVTRQMFYLCSRLYGGMQRSQLAQFKELGNESHRLRCAMSDLTLDKPILTETSKRNF